MTIVVKVDIDEQTVKDAEAVLQPLGFTTSDPRLKHLAALNVSAHWG
jgi:hypothetical protein